MRRFFLLLVVVSLLGACGATRAATMPKGTGPASSGLESLVPSTPDRSTPSTSSTPPVHSPAHGVTLRVGHTVRIADRVSHIAGAVEVTLEKLIFVKSGMHGPWTACLMLVSIRNVGKVTSTGPFGTPAAWTGVDGRFVSTIEAMPAIDPTMIRKYHLVRGILRPGHSERGFAILRIPDDEPGKVVYQAPAEVFIPVDPSSAA
jgi:hypothetical protein